MITNKEAEAVVVSEVFFTASQGRIGAAITSGGVVDGAPNPLLDAVVFCVLTLKNGFVVTGESLTVEKEPNMNLGKTLAKAAALRKIRGHLAYEYMGKQ